MEEHPIETIVEETVKRSFDISPESVYGFIVGLLVVAVIYLAWRLAQKEHKLIELNVDSISFEYFTLTA